MAECLQDLQRILRRDDPRIRGVFLQLGKWQIVSKDLIPLIGILLLSVLLCLVYLSMHVWGVSVTYRDELPLTLAAMKVLALMTLRPSEESIELHKQHKILTEIKDAFIGTHAVTVIMDTMRDPLLRIGRSVLIKLYP